MDWTLPPELADVPGATELFDWFGYWPTFHDGEIVDLELRRTGSSSLRVHTFTTTGEVDSRGHYVSIKHVVVKLVMDGVSDLQFNGFHVQNVINALLITRVEAGFQIELEPVVGMCGTITVARVRIELEPGIPADSITYSGR
jgi:hypothetical protein